MQLRRELLTEELDGVSSLLVLSPSLIADGDEACQSFLSTGMSGSDVLMVSVDASVDQQLGKLEQLNALPNRVGIVGVGDEIRSAASTTGPVQPIGSWDVTIDVVPNPGDLTGIGVSMVKLLSSWEPVDTEVNTCFDSVSTILQYAELQRVYRFLHVTIGKLNQSPGMSHFHMDPGMHDAQTVNTIKTLFDGVVELTDEGWTVKKR